MSYKIWEKQNIQKRCIYLLCFAAGMYWNLFFVKLPSWCSTGEGEGYLSFPLICGFVSATIFWYLQKKNAAQNQHKPPHFVSVLISSVFGIPTILSFLGMLFMRAIIYASHDLFPYLPFAKELEKLYGMF